MRKLDKKKGDRMKASRRDDTMMAGKMDKRFVEFQKISLVERRMDEKLSVIPSSSANFDPAYNSFKSRWYSLIFIPFWDLLVNCSV